MARTRAIGLALVVVFTAAACGARPATTVRLRPSTEQESKLLNAALTPLLRELRDPALHRPGCPIGVAIARTARINAGVGPGKSEPCMTFSLVVTEGAFARLPVPMLRAVLAHELGHLSLRHTPGKNTQADERAADRFAVDLLKRVERHHPEACVQLVYVLASLAEHGSLAAAWFASHPSPDRRAETVLEACNR